MKKRILLLALAVVCSLIVPACSIDNVAGIIEGELPAYERDITAAYGELPDLDVVIDGRLNEDLWKGVKYAKAENAEHGVTFFFTATLSDKGLYIGAYSIDPKIVYAGRNYFNSNTNITFVIATARGQKTLRIDAVNLKPTPICINARSRYEGVLDEGDYLNPTLSEGMSAEAFITWTELGYAKTPEYIDIRPYYCYKTNYYGISYFLYPTNNKLAKFDKNGYVA